MMEATLANLTAQLESPFVKPNEAAKPGTEYERVQRKWMRSWVSGRACRDNGRPWSIVSSLIFGVTMDKRVRFNFEIDFSNGGGLQGQEFRLDIDGDDISDKKLADYIVRDMRLLLVREVRILKKEIIIEKHKRQPDHDSA